jgi:hypothetical protein
LRNVQAPQSRLVLAMEAKRASQAYEDGARLQTELS